MNFHRIFNAALITGMAVATMAVGNAAAITYNTNAAGTGFGGGGLTLNSSGGAASASLTFVANGNTTTGTPSGLNLGQFNLTCGNCTTQALGTGATFSAFTFNLVVTDVTDGGVGTFVGTSTGGSVYSDLSGLLVTWAPASLGTGTNHATSGSFGPTSFTITPFSIIVAPNSGPPTPGETTVQATISSVPEPATFGMLGAALVGLGLARRKQKRS